jgi:hypothetical protein
MAYNLGNLWRRRVLPNRIGNWPSTSLAAAVGEGVWTIGKHARYYWLLLLRAI